MAVGDRAMLELPFAPCGATRFPRNGRLDHIVIVGSHFLMQALQRVLQMRCLQTVPRILAHHPTRLRRGCRSPRRMRSSSTARQASVLSMKARLQCIVTKWADLTIKAVADGASYAAEVTIEVARSAKWTGARHPLMHRFLQESPNLSFSRCFSKRNGRPFLYNIDSDEYPNVRPSSMRTGRAIQAILGSAV